MTQFNSASLNQHLARTYAWPARFLPGFVEVLAAQQTPDSPSWFEGTADAVRKYLRLFAEWDVDEYLILAGDHLYRMNYADFVQRHRETKADITLAVVPVTARRASDFGLLRLDHQGRVRGFSEKPTGAALHAMQVDTTLFGSVSGAGPGGALYRVDGDLRVCQTGAPRSLNPGADTHGFWQRCPPARHERVQCAGVSVPGLLGRYRDD